MLLALGDWRDKVGQNTAHRYAASKYTLSLRTVLSCAKCLEHYKSWEEIPPEVLREITNVAADHVTEALRLDCIRVWEGVTFSERTQRTVQPSASRLRNVAHTERAESSATMRPMSMPESVNGKSDCLNDEQWAGNLPGFLVGAVPQQLLQPGAQVCYGAPQWQSLRRPAPCVGLRGQAPDHGGAGRGGRRSRFRSLPSQSWTFPGLLCLGRQARVATEEAGAKFRILGETIVLGRAGGEPPRGRGSGGPACRCLE